MKPLNLTEEQKQAIIEDYKNPELKTNYITQKHNIGCGTLIRIVQAAGVPLRHPGKQKNRDTAKSKTCPRCRKKVNTPGARFCPFCGADIRNENELLAEKIGKLIELNKFIPENARDEFVNTLIAAEQKLKRL